MTWRSDVRRVRGRRGEEGVYIGIAYVWRYDPLCLVP